MDKRRGFTLIELLVVIAIIALLMGILIPALATVKERARRQTCAARVRQHVLVLNMYADDYNFKLPLPGTTGYWLQDLALNTRDFMLRLGMTMEMFYCPSNSTHQKHMKTVYEFGNNNGYFVAGYCYILEADPGSDDYPRDAIRAYEKDPIQKKWIRTTQMDHPALRELVVDSIMGQNRGVINEKYGFNFSEVAGGLLASGIYDRTSHLKYEKDPVGGNIGYMDGHTEWRDFEPDFSSPNKAKPRVGSGESVTVAPAFFW